MNDRLAEQRALLTRASELEARRQVAVQRGDHQGVDHAEAELARLWARYYDLEQRERVA